MNNTTNNALVTLVGAGCGSRDWITLEGLQALQTCDAVVYDDLIDSALLDEVPADAERVYVGKRMNGVSARQEDIHSILLELSGRRSSIVRLKGGDPFVFGRGGEEILFLKEHGVACHVVPGISSCLAIPEQAGIPVTHRGMSRSIHVMTAHTKEDRLRQDLEQFAHLEGTLVFLMGLNSLATICQQLIAFGKDAATPAAVLSGGNSPSRRTVCGTLQTIPELAKDVASPAIILVGEVTALNLFGRTAPMTVGITGTDAFQGKLRRELNRRGIDSLSFMTGSVKTLDTPIDWDCIAGSDSWLVFSSAKGVEGFFRRCRADRIDQRRLASCRYAVIGAETARALESFGIQADLCPKEFNSLCLSKELVQAIGDARPTVHLFCSAQGTHNVEAALTQAGIAWKRWDLYDTALVCRPVPEKEPDWMLFGSAEGVRTLHRSGYRFPEHTKALCIGPICADAFRSCFGFEPSVSVQSLVSSMAEYLSKQ